MAEAPRVIVTTHDGAVVGDLDPRLVTALTMTRQVNGEHTLSVTTTQALAKNDRLLLRDGTLRWHEFVVEGITAARPDSGGDVQVTYYCPWSVQHDLSETFINGPYDCGIVPGHASIMHPAIDGITVALGSTSRWAIGTVDVATQAAASFYRQTGWEGMQTVVEKWGGEVEADITVGLDGVTGRSVSLLTHVGSEEATRRFDYAADMRGIKRTVQDTPWTCRIVPLGKSRETEAGGYTRRPSIESVNGGVMWIEDADAVPLTRMPDGSGGWEYPTQIVYNDVYEEPAELLVWALEHITDYTRPKVTYEADVVQLARAGLSPLGVGLGDEVAIVDRAFCEGGLRIQGRVLKMVEDLLDPSNTKLTIGNLGTTLASQLSGIARDVYEITSKVDNLTQVQSTAEYVSNLISRMNAEANATGGYTYITEGQGIRTYDRPVSDPLVGTEATQVVEVKGGTIRIANSRGAQGDWEWRTVFTSGHVAADVVTAAQITTGYIGSEGGTFIDLDNDTVQLGSSDSFHVVADSQELGFYQADTRVAYVNGNQLYIPYTVVLNAMQVGEEGNNCWEWRLQDNGNLTLTWIG